MSSSRRGVWGQGRTEVAALRDEIEAARGKGRSVKSIYDEFRAAGRVTVSYKNFCENVKGLSPPSRPESPSRSTRSTPAAASPVSASAAAAAGSPSRPPSFRLDPAKRLEDLV